MIIKKHLIIFITTLISFSSIAKYNIYIDKSDRNYKTIKTSTDWIDYEEEFDCTEWSPVTSNVRKGTPFTQTRTCSQKQIQNWIYSNNDSEEIHSVANSRTIEVNKTQEATGNRAYNWVYCAPENGTCSFNSSQARYVRYGQNGAYKIQWKENNVSCSNGVFGDPLVGTVKSCWYDY